MKKRTSEIFIFIFTALALSYFTNATAGTCSSISRTNNSANSVLTSTKLNSDFNAVYGAANALDGGCVTDGTLEIDSTDSSWDNLKNYLQSGCKVSYSNASTVSISKCYLAVNGAYVGKSTASTVAFGCGSCSSEVASTVYYVYVSDGSTGTTLTPLILTGAPNADGYDASNNKVIARFYNSATSDIDQYSIDQWNTNKFVPSNTDFIDFTPTTENFGTLTSIDATFRRVGGSVEVQGTTQVGTTVGAAATIALPNSLVISDSKAGSTNDTKVFGTMIWIGSGIAHDNDMAFFWYDGTTTDKIFMSHTSAGSTALTKSNGNQIVASNETISFWFTIPVEGWFSE